MKIALALVCFALATAPAAAQPPNDAERLALCVDTKAGPEGDLPPAGPVRDRLLAQMAGGPQACISLIYDECMKASKDSRACNRRESQAWIDALKLSGENRKRFARRNIEVYLTAINRIREQARALCHAAAAVSAWGSNAVASGTFERGDHDTTACQREAIAQQALVVLVTSRGN
ncbi:MAG: hypothetical protein Q8M31_07920 [Beijerinckiaceae bacterium]|nr:hypothetical protein [Beijerinckiaceae bacterium]